MKNKFLLIVFGAVLLLALSGIAQAANTNTAELYNPATSSIVSGTAYTLKAEVNGTAMKCEGAGCTAALANVTNVTFQISVDGVTYTNIGVNSSNVNNGTLSNWTYSFNSANYRDNTTWRFRILVSNESKVNTSMTKTNTGITIDNTVPVITLDTKAGTLTSGSITATAENASDCTIRFSTNSQSYAMTKSGTSCVYTPKQNFPPDGTYTVFVVATDGTNATNSASKEIAIDLFRNTGVSETTKNVGVQIEQKETNKTILIALVVAGAVYMLFLRKK